MFSANTYRIRLANAADTDTIDGWGAPPLTGRVLVGEIDGNGRCSDVAERRSDGDRRV